MLDVTHINRHTFAAALHERQTRTDLRMLVVEDQKFSRLMLKNFLAKNYAVAMAESGEEALAIYVATAPDIVFLDIELPKISGHQVRDLLVKLDPGAFIAMVTANNSRQDVATSMKGGAKGFIVKPYTKEKIFDVIDKYIQEKQAR